MERNKVQDLTPEELQDCVVDKIFQTGGYCTMCGGCDWDPNDFTQLEKREYCLTGTCPDCQKQLFTPPEPQDYDEAQLQDLEDRRDAYRIKDDLVALADFMDDGSIEIIRTRTCQIDFGPVLSSTRLSQVEQDENGAWWATVLPAGPNLGPAKTYTAAIQEEMRYFAQKQEENHDRSSDTT